MVAHLGLRNHELFYEEIGNIIAFQPERTYEDVANHSQRIFNLIKNDNFYTFLK